jgi:casein kinase II subunit beta
LESDTFLSVYQDAVDLYGLFHQRFLLSEKGLFLMREKVLNGVFGTCPRVLCTQQNVVPIGLSDELKQCRIKVFCPKCQDVFFPKKKCSDVDGAFFGSSFPHVLLQRFPELQPKEEKIHFVPQIFGFKIKGKRNEIYERDFSQ